MGKKVWMLLNLELWMRIKLAKEVIKAIILAAGKGSRLQKLLKGNQTAT